MAFSADELRVLRRALAEALHHAPFPPAALRRAPAVPAPAGEPVSAAVYLRLTDALDEAVRENARLAAFRLAELARYRAALPAAAAGYLDRLAEALDAGHQPVPEDLAALRALAALPCGPVEARHRAGLLRRCAGLLPPADRPAAPRPAGQDRARLLALPGGRATAPARAAGRAAVERPPARPAGPDRPDPGRRVPTPAEVWPPRRREPPAEPPHRATG